MVWRRGLCPAAWGGGGPSLGVARSWGGWGSLSSRARRKSAPGGFTFPAGAGPPGPRGPPVTPRGRFRSLEELRHMVVASTSTGAQVHLSDVAKVEDGYKELRTRNRLNAIDSVTFEVQKQGGSNTVAIADHVYKVLADMKGTLQGD